MIYVINSKYVIAHTYWICISLSLIAVNCSKTTIRWPGFTPCLHSRYLSLQKKSRIRKAGLTVKYIGFICSKRLEIYDFMKVIKPWTEFWFAQAGGAAMVHLKIVLSPHFRKRFTNKIVTKKNVEKCIAEAVLSS